MGAPDLNGIQIDFDGDRALVQYQIWRVVHQRQCSVASPAVKIAPHGRNRREVFWQHPPRNASTCHINNSVQNLAHVSGSRAATGTTRRDKWLDNAPLGVSQIAWIADEFAAMFSAGDISPRHRGLHRIFINPTESHPTEITQQLLNRALSTCSLNRIFPKCLTEKEVE